MQSQLSVSKTKESSKVQVFQKQHYKNLNALEIKHQHEGNQISDLYEKQVPHMAEKRYSFLKGLKKSQGLSAMSIKKNDILKHCCQPERGTPEHRDMMIKEPHLQVHMTTCGHIRCHAFYVA